MKITDIEIRLCRSRAEVAGDYAMRMGGASGFEFLVVTLETDSGVKGHSLGFAGRGVEAAGHVAAASLKPFFLGRDPLAREKHWQEFRTHDRWWHLVPDLLLWPLRHLPLGHRRETRRTPPLPPAWRISRQGPGIREFLRSRHAGGLCRAGPRGEEPGLARLQASPARPL